jgi:hypothetical protein
LPRKESFTTRNSQGLLNSTRTRGHRSDWSGQTGVPLSYRLQDTPPVRPLRNTGLTVGISLISLVPNLGANTISLVGLPALPDQFSPFKHLSPKATAQNIHEQAAQKLYTSNSRASMSSRLPRALVLSSPRRLDLRLGDGGGGRICFHHSTRARVKVDLPA